MSLKKILRESCLILLGSALYAVSTVLFIFPGDLVLGGTSGLSVILQNVLPFTPGSILTVINFSLLLLAFLILGREMAVKTLAGSTLTTLFVWLFEMVLTLEQPLIPTMWLSGLVGAVIIAVASGVMFYVDSSSGGTDILALILKKFFRIRVGRALLITDVLIVLLGGLFSGLGVLLASLIGLVVKTLGIDLVISLIGKYLGRKKEETA